MKKYVIECLYEKQFHAGSKARDDIMNILKKMDFVDIILREGSSNIKKYISTLSLGINLRFIDKNSVVVIQWPLANHKFVKKLINKLNKKNAKKILLIHDLVGLRTKDKFEIKKEIEILNDFDIVISHNKEMKKWLENNGLNVKCITLGIFDYLIELDRKVDKNISSENAVIVYAGNLSEEKSGFLRKIDNRILKNINLELYGPNLDINTINSKIKYYGVFKAEDLPFELSGDYGLIWDGDSMKECSGSYGEYLMYNNPHKASLYLASGLPLIVWDKSALKEFIVDNKIGITINSLDELSNIKIDDEYMEMKKNVIKMRKDIINGIYTKNTICKALNLIK
ncbi:hypothetical protein C0L77_001241 [Clostridium perfringens]|nr:hypothetical protein [Clostridium perfringens]